MLLNRENLEGIYTSLVEPQKQKSSFLTVAEDEVTEVDLTNIVTGEDTSHEHIYEKKYDENNHWQECFLCGDRKDEQLHHIITVGEDTCNTAISQRREYCKDACGYSKLLPRKPHNESEWQKEWVPSYRHYTFCLNEDCGQWIKVERCIDSQGVYLNCTTVGTCNICGQIYTEDMKGHHTIVANGECIGCGQKLADIKVERKVIEESKIEFLVKIVPLINMNIDDFWTIASDYITNSDVELTQMKQEKEYCLQVECKFTNKNLITNAYLQLNGSYTDGNSEPRVFQVQLTNLIPDNYAPTYISASVEEDTETSEEYNRKTTVTATFRDTWDSEKNTVEIRILDSDQLTEISGWKLATRGGTDNTEYTGVFDIVTEASERKTIYVQARDACGNESELHGIEITKKLDAKAPMLISQDGNVEEWKQSKEITFEIIDEGIGKVKVAFNNKNEYEDAIQKEDNPTHYTKKYNFVGDVYGEATGALYMQDGLGNFQMEKITIKNIDGTEPKIKDTEFIDGKIIVIANDRNEKLQAEGSGIKRFKCITKDEEEKIIEAEEIGESIDRESLQIAEEDKIYKINLSDFAGLTEVQILPIDLVGNEGQTVTVKLPNIKSSVITNVGTSIIDDKEQKVSYEIEYKAEIENYAKALTVTITDILPYDIDKEKTNIQTDLDGGTYDEANKKITWIENIGENTEDSIRQNKEENITRIDGMSVSNANVKDEIDENGIRIITVTKNITIAFKGINPTGENFTSIVKGSIELEGTNQSEQTQDVPFETETEFTKVIKITKNWEYGNNKYEKPKQVKLQVKDKKKTDEVVQEYVVGEDENWTHIFTDLPKYDEEGNEIEYTVDEQAVEGENLDYYKKEIK